MDTSKILTADLLDLVFDDRNKSYGAYELRKTYPSRIRNSLFFTFLVTGLALAGSVLGKTADPDREKQDEDSVVIVRTITEDPVEIPLEKPERRQDPVQTRTERYINPVVVPDHEADDPLPEQEELRLADISTDDRDGTDPTGLIAPPSDNLDGGRDIIEERKPEPEIYEVVQVQARFAGNWEKFLLRHLRGDVPLDNGAPAGRYTVEIQFVVDKEGNISDLKPLTRMGYGMEEEAIRVLKKSDRWEPAIQAGYKVKAYRVQRITFVIEQD